MKKSISVFLCIIIIFGCRPLCFASDDDRVNALLKDTAQYVYKTVSEPQVGSVGGEWAVIGLARSGEDIPREYYEKYCIAAEEYIKSRGGVLHENKYTEYSRLILAFTAIGKNPENAAGYNLLTPLGDYEKTITQGINGAIWALIALDSGSYEIPANPTAKTQATREMYVNYILENQCPNGGWALSGASCDPDVTAMALCALCKYQNITEVKAASQKAIEIMSECQNESGGFSSQGVENAESCAQMIIALCALGISPYDSRFVKNGNTMTDNLASYRAENNGFKHTKDSESNQMATEQCLLALDALKRFNEGKNILFDMSDAPKPAPSTQSPLYGLAGKNADVAKISVVSPGKTFEDIKDHPNRAAIEVLSERSIINGKTQNSFEPYSPVTRAEFAAVIVRGLGLPLKGDAGFLDVSPEDWFYDFVNTANYYGIIKGTSDEYFNPGGTITREEAAAMTARAAQLCGMSTELSTVDSRDILAEFPDYVYASGWALSPLAFCFKSGILPEGETELEPQKAASRAQSAQMLYNLLYLARLI